MFLSGAGIALIGLAPGYRRVLALVVVMGLGVAAWHPEGYKTATGVAGDRKATALSWFSLGGNVGIALGPAADHGRSSPASGLPGTLGMLRARRCWSARCSLAALPAVRARGRARRGRRPRRGARA